MSILIDTSFPLKGYIESQIGGREENQDAAGSVETVNGTLVVVCDGMGGTNGGSLASKLAVHTIIDDAVNAREGEDPRTILEQAIRHANEVIRQKGEEEPEFSQMGTTVTALLISDECAVAAHVGDSRIYQIRSRKKVFRTDDHSLVFQSVLAGKISVEQARLSANSNVILKALGIGETVEPDFTTLSYLKKDRFILCTDGFWGAMPEADFIRMMTRRGPLKDVLEDAARQIDWMGIKKGGHHDNLTAAALDVLQESKRKTPMSKKNKLIVAILSLLLAVSLAGNICALTHRCAKQEVPQEQQAKQDEGKAKDGDAKTLSEESEGAEKAQESEESKK